MSIHDIIEAALTAKRKAWEWFTIDQLLVCGFDRYVARFIATFDPEHVALMEAVCEAVGRCGSGLVMDAPHEWRTVAEAYDALTAYRKEREL